MCWLGRVKQLEEENASAKEHIQILEKERGESSKLLAAHHESVNNFVKVIDEMKIRKSDSYIHSSPLGEEKGSG